MAANQTRCASTPGRQNQGQSLALRQSKPGQPLRSIDDEIRRAYSLIPVDHLFVVIEMNARFAIYLGVHNQIRSVEWGGQDSLTES